ncbi:hypothetical protein BRC86_02300 [Halobacteriales archaeon QS_3_64_16]|nr:MAG: hypothetical protein BRC86_02300 [Halobacteriales archaeon QS_3_64_16]
MFYKRSVSEQRILRAVRSGRIVADVCEGASDREVNANGGEMTTDATLTECVLVPVASDTDARTTCRVLRSYSPDRVITVHVIEKAGSAPDKAGVEQRRCNA